MDQGRIEYVIDLRTGVEHLALAVLPTPGRDVAQMRLAVFDDLAHERPSWICAGCHQPIWPKHGPFSTGVYFYHFAGEGKECPYEQTGPRRLDLVDAMRYNGLKEGPDHKAIKDLLVKSLDACPKTFPASPKVEKNWYSADQEKWRRPDVAAVACLPGAPPQAVAFEVQLSAIYLHVVAERRKFYLENGALLFWVFKEISFDPRTYQDDLFYNNNSNLFVVNEDTLARSRVSGTLMFECHYLRPELVDGQVVETWVKEMVCFDQLTLDLPNQRAYFFDCEEARKTLEENTRRQKQDEARGRVKIWMEMTWAKYQKNGPDEAEADFRALVRMLAEKGIPAPGQISREYWQFALLVLSAERGKGVAIGDGWSLLQVANQAEISYQPRFYYFYKVLSHYGRWEQLFEEDTQVARKKAQKGRKHIPWRERRKQIHAKILAGLDGFERDADFLPLFGFLYPEIPVGGS